MTRWPTWGRTGIAVCYCPLCMFPLERDVTGGHLSRCVANVAAEPGGWLAFGPVGMAPVVPRRLEMRTRS